MEGERAATTDASEAALAAEELEALLETDDAPAEFVVPEPVAAEQPPPKLGLTGRPWPDLPEPPPLLLPRSGDDHRLVQPEGRGR